MANKTDDFSVDGNLHGRTPSGGGSDTWSVLSGTWDTSSGQARATALSSGSAYAVLESGSPGAEVQVTVATISTGCGLVARATDLDNLYVLVVITGGFTLYRRQSGSFTQIGAGGTATSGDVVKLRCEGDDLTVYKNGVQVFQATGQTFNNSATKHGVFTQATGARLDDWSSAGLAATAFTLTGPSSGRSGKPSTYFQAAPNGPVSGTVVVTPDDNGDGGAFTPSSLTWTNGTADTKTFTYTPASTGSKSVGVTNDGGLGNPSDVSFTANATAAYTSSQTGDWDAVATWNGAGPPTTGDTATVAAGHTVTVDTSESVGNSPAEGNAVLTVAATASLVVAAGASLTVRGDLSNSGTVQVGTGAGGAVLEFDASGASSPSTTNYRYYGAVSTALFLTRGLLGSRSSVRSNAGGGNAYFAAANNGSTFGWEYTDFLRVGDATNDLVSNTVITNPGSPTTQMAAADCTFTDCGRIATGNSLQQNTGLSLVRCKFLSGEHATHDLRVTASATGVGVTRVVNACSFEKRVFFDPGCVAITNSYLGDEYDGSTATWAAGQFDGNIVRVTALSGTGVIGVSLRGDSDGCYFLADAGTDNPHIVLPRDTGAAQTLSNAVIEYTKTFSTDAGNAFYGSGEWTMDGVIILPAVHPDNDPRHCAGSVTFGAEGTCRVVHCTLFSPSINGGVLVGDTGSATGVYAEVKSNIFWVPPSLAGEKSVYTLGGDTTDDAVTPAGCVYNGHLNMDASPYQGNWPTTQPGANDTSLSATPLSAVFVAPDRNIATWAVTRGSTSATYPDRVADALSYLLADPTNNVPDLIAHVRGGFVVKHAAWRTAAHDGTVLGAVQDEPPAVSGVSPALLLLMARPEEFEAAATTAVGQQGQLLWNALAAVGSPRELLWTDLAAVGDARQGLWNTLVGVGDARHTPWHTRAAVGSSREAVFNVLAAVGQERAAVWNALAGVGLARQALWTTLAPAGDEVGLVWDTMFGLEVGTARSLAWNVGAAVGAAGQLLWDARALAAADRGLVWGTNTTAGAAVALPWHDLERAGLSRQALWGLRAAAGGDLDFLWRTLATLRVLQVYDMTSRSRRVVEF